MTIVTEHPLEHPPRRGWVARAVLWWLGELRAVRDDLLHRIAAGARHAVTIEAGERYWIVRRQHEVVGHVDWRAGWDQGRAALQAVLARLQSHRTVLVELPRERVLSKTVSLPAGAQRHLDSIVEYEVARHFPFPAERMAFRYRPAHDQPPPDTGQMAIEIVAVPREVISGICEELRQAGVSPRRFALIGGDDATPILLPATANGAGVGSPLAVNRNMAIAAAAAALAAIVSWPLAQQARLAAIEKEIAAYKPAAEAVLRQSSAHRRDVELAAAVIGLGSSRPPLVAVLSQLSDAVPKDSWLTSLSIEGRSIVLDGLSPSAATAALALERSRAFRDITFRSPINRDVATGLERFEFGATIVEDTR
jgi:general secretion pathway protein L